MGIQEIQRQLDDVLDSKDGRVMLLAGRWGSGKTYQFKRAVARAQQRNTKGPFSLVSLFGVGTLNDLRRRISEEVVATVKIGGSDSSAGQAIAEEGWRLKPAQLIKLLPVIPWVQKLEGIAQELSFFAVRNAVVCLDDLERRGSGLAMKEVLGLAAFLRDERNCRVIIISDDEKLGEESTQTLQVYNEKVLDETVRVEPSTAEACGIAFGTPASAADSEMVACLERLGVCNIRVIHRVRRLGQSIEAELVAAGPEVREGVVASLVLFSVLHWLPTDDTPSVDYVLARTAENWLRFSRTNDTPTSESKRDARWNNYLDEYGYAETNELDSEIAASVRRGYFDTPSLLPILADFAARAAERHQNEQFHIAWKRFFHSLIGSGDDTIASLRQITLDSLQVIGLSDISTAYEAFVQLQTGDVANEVLDGYVSANSGKPERFAVGNYPFPLHDSVRDRFLAEYAARQPVPSAEELIEKIDFDRDWNLEDVKALATHATDADIARLLQTAEGQKFRQRIRTLMNLSQLWNDPLAAALTQRTRTYLEGLAQADPVVRVRMAQYLAPQPTLKLPHDGPHH